MIDTEAVKNRILDLAIHGKLVEQRKEEGSGENLYKEIKNEVKSRTGIVEAPPYKIPDTWYWVTLGSIAKITMGQSPSGSSVGYEKDGIEFHQGKICFTDKYIADSHQKTDEPTKIVEAESVLLCVRAPVGVVNVTPRRICIGRGLCGLTPFGNISSDFLFYWLKAIKKEFEQKATGSTFSAISSKNVDKQPIALPPLKEQMRIVDAIKSVFEQIECIDKLQHQYSNNITSLNKKILDLAVRGKLVPQDPNDEPASVLLKKIAEEKQKLITEGKIKKKKARPAITEDEIPFDIPDSWEWVRLNDIIENGPANGFSPKGVDYPTDYKNLTLTATTSGKFKTGAFKYVDITKEQAKKYFLKEDDILIQRSNSRELVGTACLYTEGPDKYIYPDLMMRIHALDGICPQYLVITLQSPYVRGYYQQNASGSSQSMPKINQSIVGNTLIPIPPLHEQKKIVQTVNRLIPTLSSLC